MDPQKITELAKLLRNNGDKILNSEFKLTLSGSLLRALNDSFTLIADSVEAVGSNGNQAQQFKHKPQQPAFEVVKPINSKSNVFRDLQLVHDFVQKTTLLCIVHYPTEHYFEGEIDISKFRALKRLEVQKIDIRQIVGIQPLRAQLQQLICVKSLRSGTGVEDIITHCGGDDSNGFVWNELKIADFSYNSLETVDTSLEFAQYLQHLNLRHNKLRSVEAVKWLPHIKTLDLSYNCLQCVPQFHLEAYKRLQTLNVSNNYIEDLMGVAKLDALTDLDLSDNCLLEHTQLLPLSALLTLSMLNLYGNPLHCHPRHRQATAQYLHKNTATMKFVLDYEPLTKQEKALTGTHQLRYVGALNRYGVRSSATSINSSSRLISNSSATPASSVGSLQSFKLQDSSTEADSASIVGVEANSSKKRLLKTRTVDFEDEDTVERVAETTTTTPKTPQQQFVAQLQPQDEQSDPMQKSSHVAEELSSNVVEHLAAKQQIETLRKKYGAEWLQTGNAEMMQSALGIDTPQPSDIEREKSRQLFDDYLGELSANATKSVDEALATSTPTNDSLLNKQFIKDLTPIKQTATNSDNATNDDTTLYHSLESDANNEATLYASLDASGPNGSQTAAAGVATLTEDIIDEHAHLQHVYASSSQSDEDAIEISDTEPDEDCYIVYNSKRSSEPIFFTISTNFLREKDTLTQRTKTKWSIKILESCERLKSNTLCINFDTIKVDKQERVYIVEEDLCQQLQHKLRAILSQRDLAEMNIIVYRCVNCSCQFTREQKQKHFNDAIRCPDCRSTFVAELHDMPKSLDKPTMTAHEEKLSPAAIVEESPIATSLIVRERESSCAPTEDSSSIGSANSMAESSSCSKLTNSQGSFNSNQSVVGSSNTERELEFRTNGESDVDIISNPSQSSIEILEQNGTNASRKTSEERHMGLDALVDQSNSERDLAELPAMMLAIGQAARQAVAKATTFESVVGGRSPAKSNVAAATTSGGNASTTVANVLTESSSSGSVTDSICTTYEQSDKQKTISTGERQQLAGTGDKIVLHNMLVTAESGAGSAALSRDNSNESNTTPTKQATNGSVDTRKEDTGLSSMFGALIQSTNILMSSSKKLIDAESTANIKCGLPAPGGGGDGPLTNPNNCQAYKFNYSEFNDIDHRLKLYFYQMKFKEAGERFKWLARGRIYNEQSQTLCNGIVVMSTCKCYVMEAFAAEHDDVAKWLRQLVSVTMDRLDSIQLLPWKIGLAFTLRDWGGFLLLLQDILRTDSLLLYFANSTLPTQCDLDYQPAPQIIKRLNAAVKDEQLKMCSLLNGCQISCENAKRTFDVCALLATDAHLYLSSSRLDWLSISDGAGNAAVSADSERDIEVCVKQFMSNLVEVERTNAKVYVVNFLDETQNKCETWELRFETEENADSCLNAIGQSWEKLFGVPLINA